MNRGELIRHRAIITLTVIVILFMLFTIGRNLLHAFSIGGEVSQLESEAKEYREQIRRDSTLIEELKFDDKLEKYAREHYHMQRRAETVYIISE